MLGIPVEEYPGEFACYMRIARYLARPESVEV